MPYWSILMMLPLIAGITVIPIVMKESVGFASCFTAFLAVISWMLWEVCVPLIKK